jgi:hypothetical protein
MKNECDQKKNCPDDHQNKKEILFHRIVHQVILNKVKPVHSCAAHALRMAAYPPIFEVS